MCSSAYFATAGASLFQLNLEAAETFDLEVWLVESMRICVSVQRLLSSDEETTKLIIQEITFLVSSL